jgi:general secretion pathway protein A
VTAATALIVAAGGALVLLDPAWLRDLVTVLPGRAATPPSPPPAPPVVMATAAEPPPREPTLAEMLQDPSVIGDERSAFTQLYARWRLDAPATAPDLGCEYARRAGLRCLLRTGTWTVLRRFNLPAILRLVTSGGEKRYVVLTALDGQEATLQLGERRVVVPTAEIERFWDGPFVVLWKPPVVGPLPLKPGMRGRDVLWLRQRLSDLDGQPAVRGASPVYDDDLKRRVAAFQEVESLTPDGIAGEETLVRLATAMPGSAAPWLKARP